MLRTHKHELLVEGVKKVEFEYINYLSREEKKVMKSGEKTSIISTCSVTNLILTGLQTFLEKSEFICSL